MTTAFARVGFSGDYGGTYFMTQLVGAAKARELYFLSERGSAEEALRLGLVNWICARGSGCAHPGNRAPPGLGSHSGLSLHEGEFEPRHEPGPGRLSRPRGYPSHPLWSDGRS